MENENTVVKETKAVKKAVVQEPIVNDKTGEVVEGNRRAVYLTVSVAKKSQKKFISFEIPLTAPNGNHLTLKVQPEADFIEYFDNKTDHKFFNGYNDFRQKFNAPVNFFYGEDSETKRISCMAVAYLYGTGLIFKFSGLQNKMIKEALESEDVNAKYDVDFVKKEFDSIEESLEA